METFENSFQSFLKMIQILPLCKLQKLVGAPWRITQTRRAMADQGSPAAMVGQGSLWPWAGHTGHGYMAPPKKIIQEIKVWGALWRSGHLRNGPCRSGHLRSGPCRSGHLRSGPWRNGSQRGRWACVGRRAANGGGLGCGAANGGGLGCATADGGLWWGTADGLGDRLVLDRGWTLLRHRRIPSLQLSPVVSGRSTERCNLPRSRAVFSAIPQNSHAYSNSGRSRRARAENSAAISIAAGRR